jgi:hypothetical protein
VHLQEVVTEAGDRQLQKVEADAPVQPRRDGESEEEAGGRQILCLRAALTRWRMVHVLMKSSTAARPAAPATARTCGPEPGSCRARSACRGTSRASPSASCDGAALELVRHRDAQAVAPAAPAPEVEEPVPLHEATAPGLDDLARRLRLPRRRRGNGPKRRRNLPEVPTSARTAAAKPA